MYPFLRHVKEVLIARHLPAIGLLDPHASRHICWPWDLDPWGELNNGRTLTLFDFGRTALGLRTGLDRQLLASGWGMAVAGSTVRYRRRVTAFTRLTMHSRNIGWDARFFYTEQSMWRAEDCTSHVLIRSAFTSKAGIVPPADVVGAMGLPVNSPALPEWVQAWIRAEDLRPWPPTR